MYLKKEAIVCENLQIASFLYLALIGILLKPTTNCIYIM